MSEENLNDIKLEVELIKKDIAQFDVLCDKVTNSIEKMQDVNHNLLKMISLHEQRHEQHEKVEDDIEEDVKDLHSRITSISREIHDRIDQVEHHITERIDDLKSDLIKHKQDDGFKFKIPEFEKLKWLIMGAILVFGILLGKFDIFTLFSVIK